MIDIQIKSELLWDEAREEFLEIPPMVITLEHSLVSISKWEAEYCKPFLSKTPMTNDELKYYIKCMTITKNVPDEVYNGLTNENMVNIEKYIDRPMTATTVRDNNKNGRNQVVTSEVIYSWMVAQNIPFECQKWHLNRLMMLIRVCTAHNQPEKKLSQRELMRRNAAMNAANRKRFKSRG